MTEGLDRSLDARLEAHGHVEPESVVFKIIRKLGRPLGLFQPAPWEVGVKQVERLEEDPLEDTPEEAVRELQGERFASAPRFTDNS